MATKETAKFRKTLRHAILDEFPNLDERQIYAKIKKDDAQMVFFSDLYPFCEKANIPIDQVKKIFASYQIFTDHISLAHFVVFLQDEYFPASGLEIPSNLTGSQKDILSQFIQAFQCRRTQATPPFSADSAAQPLSSEPSLISQQWILILKYNPPNSDPSKVRIAAFLKFKDEMNLSFSFDDFLDAIFAFFDAKVDSLTFGQFARLIYSNILINHFYF